MKWKKFHGINPRNEEKNEEKKNENFFSPVKPGAHIVVRIARIAAVPTSAAHAAGIEEKILTSPDIY